MAARQIFSMVNIMVFFLSVLVVSVVTRDALAATLVLDELSFVFFEGEGVGGSLPSGGRIEWDLEPLGEGRYSVVVGEQSLQFPPMTYPSGRTVRWTLSGPAKGTLERTREGVSCWIEAPLVAHVDGNASPVPFPLRFTTEEVQRSAQGFVARRQGVRIDAESGYIQLVAAGVSPPGAPTAPGKPFYVVLSGTLSGLPSGLVGR